MYGKSIGDMTLFWLQFLSGHSQNFNLLNSPRLSFSAINRFERRRFIYSLNNFDSLKIGFIRGATFLLELVDLDRLKQDAAMHRDDFR